MNIKNIKYVAAAMLMGVSMTSCEAFLDRPVEDNYNTENFYTDDASCVRGVNYLYNSPWYDFLRGFIKIGEVMSGNMYWGSSPYMNFSLNGTDQDLVNMSYSLWAEIGHANTVYNSIKGASCSQSVKDQCMGECLAWKAMAYFYLVRTFGDVPIVHDNSVNPAAGDYNTLHKIRKADVYEYILMTLEKAMELLPKTKSTTGRIDYYCAEGLYAKVLLTAAGVSGSLDQSYLQRASEASLDVIQNSGRKLMENYEDIFRGSNNVSDESLIAWRWTNGAQWTSQNTLQSDLMPEGFDENGDCWGGWGGPSADLQDAFGYDVTENPANRLDTDVRRKATMMGAGDVYSYFWRDHDLGNGKTGLDIIRFFYDKTYNAAATGEFQGPCGVQNVKHAYGDNADHQAEMGASAGRMAYNLATHILRLADVYLIHAEAEVLQGHTTAQTALDAYNAVHQRAVASAADATSLSFDDIWKERRLEFAGEGDRWYDFVRRSYYDVNSCINELKAQRRNAIWGCSAVYKTWFDSDRVTWDASTIQYDDPDNGGTPRPNITANSFILPYPTEDVALNPNLASNVTPDQQDVRNTYSY
ncbi:MAG: RagB/SusD family nutrient uptake outer membrane protein [Prevotella sp.]|nr:RagB/SusD family nutrient uptake outer membrane protein [Prevotella sp.]